MTYHFADLPESFEVLLATSVMAFSYVGMICLGLGLFVGGFYYFIGRHM